MREFEEGSLHQNPRDGLLKDDYRDGAKKRLTTECTELHRGIRSLSEESGYAFFHHKHAVFGTGGTGFLFQQLQRFVDGFVREAESAVVHGNHPTGFEIEKGAHGVSGIGMDVAELRRIVGADRQ